MVYGNEVDIVQEMVTAWQQFVNEMEGWEKLVLTYEPRITHCGIVYELPNFLGRPDEGFAIVDMRHIPFAEPHYHPDEVFEVYIVVQGTALVVVGSQEYTVTKGDVVVIPPLLGHFTIPDNNFVIAVINKPAYLPEHYIVLRESNKVALFDYQRFVTLQEHQSTNSLQ